MDTHDRNEDRRGGTQAGFSLVEVLVAAGITAGILIAISALFIYGSRNVMSGRNLSAATTVAQGVFEEMRGFRSAKIYGLLNGQPEDMARSWDTDQADPTYTGNNLEFAAEYSAVLDAWRDTSRRELPHGGLSLTVEGFVNRPKGGNDGTATFGGARFLRIEVTVYWTEGKRSRQVSMDLIKF